MERDRKIEFDVARALCVIWIIVFWHSSDFFSKRYCLFLTKNFSYLTDSILATFTFMSGYFLSKYRFENTTDIFVFFKKRIQRFFIPLLVSSCILYTIGWYESIAQLLIQMLGLSMFVLPAPKTLWYFSMIIFFYLITPILLNKKGWIYAVILYFLLCLLLNIIDKRILIFLPFYICGLRINDIKKYFHIYYLKSYTALLFIIMCSACLFVEYKWYVSMFISFCGGGAIYHISKQITQKQKNITIFSYISYSSMFAYISHRIYFTLLYNYMKESKLILVIVLCVIFVTSYYLQKTYDILLNYLKK